MRILLLTTSCCAFVTVNAFTSSLSSSPTVLLSLRGTNERNGLTRIHAYVPDGLTAAEWKNIQAKEREMKKNLGKLGPRGFKSRSFQSFQEALERGETDHLLPVFNAKEKVRRGEIKKEDIPYMQRGGAWDNSDVKGAKRMKWLRSDKEYADGGFAKEQSVSIFGYGAGLDWTGMRSRSGPPETVRGRAVPKPRGYKAPNVRQLVKSDEESKKKGPFGLW